jgi:hypothetical protein
LLFIFVFIIFSFSSLWLASSETLTRAKHDERTTPKTLLNRKGSSDQDSTLVLSHELPPLVCLRRCRSICCVLLRLSSVSYEPEFIV